MIKFLIICIYCCSTLLSWAQTMTDSAMHTQVRLFTRHESGSFINWNEPEKAITAGVSVNGLKQHKRLQLKGGIKFSNQHQINIVWPLYNEAYYPYLLLETSKKTFIKNNIALAGGFSYAFSHVFESGVYVVYSNSNSYNEKDPRFKVFNYDFRLNPNFIFRFSGINILLSPNFKSSNHEINMLVELNQSAFYIYQNLGLGTTLNPILYDAYNGQISSHTLGISGDFSYKRPNLGLNLAGVFDRSTSTFEESDNLWKIIIPHADLNTTFYKLAPAISFSKDHSRQTLSYTLKQNSKTGSEYIRREESGDLYTIEFWKVYGSVDKYKYNQTDQEIRYRYRFKTIKKKFILNAGAQFTNHSETYYGIIQDYIHNYKLMMPYFELACRWTSGKYDYLLNARHARLYLQQSNNNFNNGIAADYLYKNALNYLESNPQQFKFSAKAFKKIAIAGSEGFVGLNLKTKFIRPESGNNYRQFVEIAIELNY